MTSRSLNIAFLLPLVFFILAQPSPAQQTSIEELRKQIDVLSQSVKAMQKDLQEIKTLLQNRTPAPPPQNVVLDISGHPSRGENGARLILIEFSDYQCPFCSRHFRDTAPQIDKEYIQTGKLKHVFLDLPLESIHKSAFKAAEAAHCAGEQGKFWEMHDRLFANQLTLEPWKPHAEAVGLDVTKFEDCLSSGRHAAQIRADMAEAQKAGFTGSPSFFLAYSDPRSTKVKTVARLVGAQPFASFKAVIDKLLAEPPGMPKDTGPER